MQTNQNRGQEITNQHSWWYESVIKNQQTWGYRRENIDTIEDIQQISEL